jgi:hypothetical protein
MDAGTDRAYTDRDVRDHPGYRQAVERYLEGYTGEFGFLVDMKMRAANDVDLTTGMVRGVLNCMRHDPRVTDLPAPTSEDFDDVENVIPMRSKEERAARDRHPAGKGLPERRPCPYAGQEHDSHWYPDGWPNNSQSRCHGWHALTREYVDVRVRVNRGYARGRSSNLIHRTTGEGGGTWYPAPGHLHVEGGEHRWGSFWAGVRCTVYTLKGPTLLDAAGVRQAQPYDTPTATAYGKYEDVTLCPRCFPGSEGTEIR